MKKIPREGLVIAGNIHGDARDYDAKIRDILSVDICFMFVLKLRLLDKRQR